MYQDVWVNGEVVEPGVRECSLRYEAIRAVCAPLVRGFSVLDLGCNAGYFGLRLASEFDAQVTFLDDEPRLQAIVDANDKGGTVINQRSAAADLLGLGTFDLVLAFSVLHHFDDWQTACASLLRMGEQSIIETPEPSETHLVANPERLGPMYAWLMAHEPSVLMRSESWLPNGGMRPLMCFSPTVRVGKVVSGGGYTTQQFGDYREAVEAGAGFELFPGSLNLVLDHCLHLANPITFDSIYGTFHVFRGTIGSTPCLLAKMPQAPDVPRHIEVFATPKLRDLYELSDGSTIPLTVRPEHLEV